jgi:U1 small nuclear ribonucleoprotein
MMMPPHIRATFVPNPPLKFLPPIQNRSNKTLTGVFQLLKEFEKTSPPKRETRPTPQVLKAEAIKEKQKRHEEQLMSLIDDYRKAQRDCGGQYQGMNCYNTLFVSRLAYEVTERKLLREMEAFGPVKDIKLVVNKEGKSRGFAFVEYENEEDMKRAYRAADGMRIEGRPIVVDVERGHTVPAFLPRRLGGGLGGTRLGGKEKNVFAPGRFDPNRPEDYARPQGPPPMMVDHGGPPPPGMGRGRGGGGYVGPPPGNYGPYGDRGGGGYDGDRRRRRSRSRSAERGRYAPRPRY